MDNNLNNLIDNCINLNLTTFSNVDSIFIYLKFDQGATFRLVFKYKDIIFKPYELEKELKLKLLKKNDPHFIFSKSVYKYLVDNYEKLTEEERETHPKHIRVTYDVKTEKMEVETSFVDLYNHIHMSKAPIGNLIYDEWVEELKTGVKGKYFYLKKEDEKYWFDPKTGKQRKLPKLDDETKDETKKDLQLKPR